MIGSGSVLAWVMAVGLVLDVGAIALTRAPVTLDGPTLRYMAVAGFGNAFGLPLLLSSLRLGKVGLATSIASTESAVGAVYSVLVGAHMPVLAYGLLTLTVVGVVLAACAEEEDAILGEQRTLAAGLAVASAVVSGASIFATGFISSHLSPDPPSRDLVTC